MSSGRAWPAASRTGAPRPARPRRAQRRRSTGRPPGSSVGSAPASTAPRSPARRGTQPTTAPVRSASRATAVNRPGHLGGPLPDEDDRRRRSGPRPRAGRRPPARPVPRPRLRAPRGSARPGGRLRRASSTPVCDTAGVVHWPRWKTFCRACGRPCAAAGRRPAPPPPARAPRTAPRARPRGRV